MRDGPVLFAGIPAHGHMIPALALAESLVARGLPVEFPASEEFADAVRASGARPLAYPTTWPVPAALPAPRTAADALELRAMLAGEAVAQVRAVLARPGRRPPRAVVYDTAVGPAARVLTALWGVPGVQVFTGVATSPGFSLAPLLAERYPDLAGLPPAGPDPALVRLAADHGLARDRVGALLAPRERLSLVLQPRAFHQAAQTFSPDAFAFVGPCLSRGRARTPWRPPPDAGPVLLVALGTLYNRRPAFYRSCVEAVRGTGWHAVLAVGERVSPGELGRGAPNVEVHARVPQPSVLAHARVMVCHAGMGSTMEALAAGVPLVAVPQTPEQDAVARRVQELGLGVRLPPGGVTPDRLRAAVDLLATDQGTRERVARMRSLIRSAGGADRGAFLIDAHLHRTAAARPSAGPRGRHRSSPGRKA
ncbi:macrolide family glycosyltransferase [Nocardiopsis sp. NPDC101807]|uniref:macrolide family glycosyltransferase n=1 Tax=Nocardiopsis sp. NPDC101807 TaxID=3364339 RepID=UPI00380A4229